MPEANLAQEVVSPPRRVSTLGNADFSFFELIVITQGTILLQTLILRYPNVSITIDFFALFYFLFFKGMPLFKYHSFAIVIDV